MTYLNSTHYDTKLSPIFQELSSMNQLDLLSIRTFYRQWIHSKASERSGVVISIGPDPILNRLEGPSGKESYRSGSFN